MSEVSRGASALLLSLGSRGGPVDDALFEDISSDPIASAGTYYVVISAGSGYEASSTRFQALLRLE